MWVGRNSGRVESFAVCEGEAEVHSEGMLRSSKLFGQYLHCSIEHTQSASGSESTKDGLKSSSDKVFLMVSIVGKLPIVDVTC